MMGARSTGTTMFIMSRNKASWLRDNAIHDNKDLERIA
jgi:hypothetical protein